MKLNFANYKDAEKDWRWPSFSPREMACKGTGRLVIDTGAMDKLQALRDRLGKPMIVVSAYRSPEHNRAVGGAKASQHLEAKAFDISMANHDPHQFEAAARAVGFTGFGYYVKNGFMHIDTGPARSWGDPWPMTATTWPKEPRRQPERLREDKGALAGAGAGVAGAVALAADNAHVAGSILGNLAPMAQLVAVVAAVALVGYIIWRRMQ